MLNNNAEQYRFFEEKEIIVQSQSNIQNTIGRLLMTCRWQKNIKSFIIIKKWCRALGFIQTLSRCFTSKAPLLCFASQEKVWRGMSTLLAFVEVDVQSSNMIDILCSFVTITMTDFATDVSDVSTWGLTPSRACKSVSCWNFGGIGFNARFRWTMNSRQGALFMTSAWPSSSILDILKQKTPPDHSPDYQPDNKVGGVFVLLGLFSCILCGLHIYWFQTLPWSRYCGVSCFSCYGLGNVFSIHQKMKQYSLFRPDNAPLGKGILIRTFHLPLIQRLYRVCGFPNALMYKNSPLSRIALSAATMEYRQKLIYCIAKTRAYHVNSYIQAAANGL